MRMPNQATPSDYALLTDNCTNFVSEVLRQGENSAPPTSPRPRLFFDSPLGTSIKP